MTLASILENAQTQWGQRKHIFEHCAVPKFHTFQDFYTDVQSLASFLIDAKYEDQTILLFGKNSYAWMVCDYAISAYVGVSGGANPALSTESVDKLITLTKPVAIFYDDSMVADLDALKQNHSIDFYNLDDLSTLKGSPQTLVGRSMNDPAKIFFTSGSSGFPKAALHSQRSVLIGIDPLFARAPLNETDRCFLILPLYHTYGGIYNFIFSVVFGFELHVNTDMAALTENLQTVKPTMFCTVPKMLVRFYHAIKDHPQPEQALKGILGGEILYLVSGGSFLDPKIRSFYKTHGISLMEGYGLSETASSLSIDYHDSTNTKALGTVFENIEVKIINPNQDGVGELVVKGDCLFLEYINDPEATRLSFTPDGYFKTGDLGYLDEDNFVYMMGRIKRVFKTSGSEMVSPEILEQALISSGAFEAVLVYEKDGLVAAKLILKEAVIDLNILIETINLNFPKFMHIAHFEVVDESFNELTWK